MEIAGAPLEILMGSMGEEMCTGKSVTGQALQQRGLWELGWCSPARVSQQETQGTVHTLDSAAGHHSRGGQQAHLHIPPRTLASSTRSFPLIRTAMEQVLTRILETVFVFFG